MNVAEFRPSELRTHHKNPRQGVVPAIMASLRAHGQYRPLVVNRGTHTGRVNEVLAGNHTLKAIRTLAEEYPSDDRWQNVQCWMLDVDDDEGDRIVAVDNRTSELGSFDDRLLLELLSGLPDLTGTGYDESDLAALEALVNDDDGHGGPITDPDDAPPVPETAVTQVGDVWLLGDHRVVCGDALDIDVVRKATNGAEVGIVYTDPPYGISVVSGKGGGDGPFGGVKNMGKVGGEGVVPASYYRQVLGDGSKTVAAEAMRLLLGEYPKAMHVWWGANHYAGTAELPDSSCWLVWDKENTGNFADAELAWTNHKGAVRLLRHMWNGMLRHMWNGMLRASERGKRVHPTQKPVALAEWAFSVVDSDADRSVVLDVFGGSGSTLIAAHLAGKTAALVELDPLYVDVICKRFEQVSGIAPVLEWSARGETGLPDQLDS